MEGSDSADLTAEGNLDWSCWGTDSSNPLAAVRKASVPQQISDLSMIGNASEVDLWTYSDSWWKTHQASWTDGTRTVSVDNTYAAAVVSLKNGTNQGNMGFRFTVPADTTAKTLKLYLGAMGTKGVLKASLSDGSAPDFVTSANDSDPDVINNSGGPVSKVVTLVYQAASDNATLTVEYVLNWNHWGNALWIQGAALSGADTLAPTAPRGLSLLYKGSVSAAMAWEEASDNVGIKGYDIFYGDKLIGSTAASTANYFIHGLIPGKQYDFTAKAKDAAGNISQAGEPLSVTADPDTTAPTAPRALTAASVTESQAVLAWDACIDNVGVAAYEVYENGKFIATVTDTRYTAVGLNAGTAYTYEIRVRDVNGNLSEAGNKLAIRTKVTSGSLQAALDAYLAAGGLDKALYQQLKNSLSQAEHQRSNGNPSKAVKHLEDFIKHLENKAMQKKVAPQAGMALADDARELMKTWADLQ